MDGVWICCVCYADDLVLIARSPSILEGMCKDLIGEFRTIGLGVGADKTHWTATPPLPGTCIEVDGHSIEWEATLTYVGTVVDMTGSAGPAMQLRMSKAQGKLEQWRAILTAPWLPLRRRVALLARAIWTSALWCAQTWNPTCAQREKFDSWAARAMARVMRLRRDTSEDIASWWRRMHRTGHATLRRFEVIPLSRQARRSAMRWAGHVARMEPTHWMAQVLRCRSIQWWRWRQARHCCKWTGVHPARFKASRWEAQFAELFGDGEAEHPAANTGWWAAAQDRDAWRSHIQLL